MENVLENLKLEAVKLNIFLKRLNTMKNQKRFLLLTKISDFNIDKRNIISYIYLSKEGYNESYEEKSYFDLF